jgi:flavin reductase (DIM6/NTAB) family NADH-FMN oxidoreductase RutF
MPVSSETYRNALRLFPAGVTVVTIKQGERTHGLTVSAFASVSPDPPLIMVIIDNRHSAYPFLQAEDAVFAVNILCQEQMDLSNRFAWLKDADRFEEGDWGTAVTGAPILKDALAWLDCTVYDRLAAGTHTIYIGEVQASATPRPEAAPLVYWNRGYRNLSLRESGAERSPERRNR